MSYRGMDNSRNPMARPKVRPMYSKHNDQIPPGSRARFLPGMPIPGQSPYTPQIGYPRPAQYSNIHSSDFPAVQFTAQATPVWNQTIPIPMSESYQISNQHSFPPQQQMYNPTDNPHMMPIPNNPYISQVQNQTEFDPITNVCLCSKCGFPNTLAHIQIKKLNDEKKRLMDQLHAMEQQQQHQQQQQNSNYEEGARSPALQAPVPVSSLSVDAQPFQMGATQGVKPLQGTNMNTETTPEATNRQHNPNGNDYSHRSTRNWQSQGGTPVVSASHVTNDQYNETTTSDPEWNNVDYPHQENDSSGQQETDSTVVAETPSVSANDEWDSCESPQQESNVVLSTSGPFIKSTVKQEDESIPEREQENSTPLNETCFPVKDERNETETPKSRAPKDQRSRQNRNKGSKNEVHDSNWGETDNRKPPIRRGSGGGYRQSSPHDHRERRGEKSVPDSRDSSQSRLRSGSEQLDSGVKSHEATERRLDSSSDRNYSNSRFDPSRRGGGNRRYDHGGRGRGSEDPNWRKEQDVSDKRDERRDYSRSGGRGANGGARRYPPSNFKVVTDKEGDLFTAPDDHSLAHCVAEDLRMGSGIAVRFRQMFKNVEELCDQRKGVGEVAVLSDKTRFIFYLITKERSNGKPLWSDFVSAVKELKKECVEKGVKNVAMPRIGCGLDRLDWREVKSLLEQAFSDSGVSITAYNFQQNEESESPALKSKSSLYVVHLRKNLVDIDAETGLIFLCSEESNTTDRTIESLDKKHKFMYELRTAKKTVGEVITIKKGKEYLYGLVVKKYDRDPLSYVNLGKCLRKMRSTNGKEQYGFFGIEAFRDQKDPLTMEKVITGVRNVFGGIQYKMEFYVCWPKELENDHIWDDLNSPNTAPSSK